MHLGHSCRAKLCAPKPCLTVAAGPDPVGAVRLINRLRLFPTVFEPPATQRAALGDGFGSPCIVCMAAAAQLLAAWQPQVRSLTTTPWQVVMLN